VPKHSAFRKRNPTGRIVRHPAIKNDLAKRVGRLRQRHGFIVKGKRISCPPPQHLLIRVALPMQEYDYEHGFPLIRSLRASTQRSTSVLFSFCAFLVDHGRIICHPAIKNDSGAILGCG